MRQMISSDPERLKARLNQPRVSLVEALRQTQTMIPLSHAGLKELRKSKNGSVNGRKPTEN